MKLTPTSRSSFISRGKVKNKKLFTYGFFVIIAIIVWYVNNLGKTYNTEIWIPVTYQQVPEGLLISDDPGNKLLVEVRASGFSLLKSYVYSRWDPVDISLNRYPLKPIDAQQKNRYYFLSHYAVSQVNDALGTDITVLRIYPDSMIFRLSVKKTVKVPVSPIFNFEYEKQYMPKGHARLEPDSVYVAGPASLVDTLTTVYTRLLTLKNISDTVSATLTLVTHPRLLYSFTETEAILPVERYTEATVTVPITVINIPESFNVRIFPAQITIQCKVGVSDFEKLTPSLFTAQIDYATLANNVGNSLRARVTLTQTPWWIADVSFSPSIVEYLIERQWTK